MHTRIHKLAIAGLLMGLATTANAALLLDTSNFTKADATPTPGNTIGDHQYVPTQGEALSFGQLYLDQAGVITFEFLFSEAAYTNELFEMTMGDSVVFNNKTTAVGSIVGPFEVGVGYVPIKFCTSGTATPGTDPVPRCVDNTDATNLEAQWDINGDEAGWRAVAFLQESEYSWLAFFDDSGLQNDDDFDDMIVRIRFDVPEPATLALLGIGLIGMGAARRRKAA